MSAWFRAPAADAGRWVVLDVEASGLDPERDRLLAIAGVAVRRVAGAAPCIDLGDSFEVVLRQEEAPPDRANILVHGIGVQAQRGGAESADALRAFADWAGDAPRIAFHAAFDRRLLQRAAARHGRTGREPPWLDLAQLAPALQPGVPARALDDWMAELGIICAARHRAAADAHATAELLLRLWPAVRAQRAGEDFGALQRIAADARWLPR